MNACNCQLSGVAWGEGKEGEGWGSEILMSLLCIHCNLRKLFH